MIETTNTFKYKLMKLLYHSKPPLDLIVRRITDRYLPRNEFMTIYFQVVADEVKVDYMSNFKKT